MIKSIYIFENKNIRVNLYVNDEAYKNQVKKRYRTSNVVNIFVVATYLPFFYCFSIIRSRAGSYLAEGG